MRRIVAGAALLALSSGVALAKPRSCDAQRKAVIEKRCFQVYIVPTENFKGGEVEQDEAFAHCIRDLLKEKGFKEGKDFKTGKRNTRCNDSPTPVIPKNGFDVILLGDNAVPAHPINVCNASSHEPLLFFVAYYLDAEKRKLVMEPFKHLWKGKCSETWIPLYDDHARDVWYGAFSKTWRWAGVAGDRKFCMRLSKKQSVVDPKDPCEANYEILREFRKVVITNKKLEVQLTDANGTPIE